MCASGLQQKILTTYFMKLYSLENTRKLSTSTRSFRVKPNRINVVNDSIALMFSVSGIIVRVSVVGPDK